MTAASIALALLPLAGGASATASTPASVPAVQQPTPAATPDPAPDATPDATSEPGDTTAPEDRRPAAAPPTMKFRAATINALGSSHTSRKGSPYASGTTRVSYLYQLLESRDLQVAALQEFQPDQRQQFAKVAKGWVQWPGGTKWNAGTTSIVWRADRWNFVDAKFVDIPFYDQVRRSPAVELQHKTKGIKVWFSSFHNPADTAKFRNQAANRVKATKVQASLANRIARTGVPQVLMGDMNERGSYYCRITSLARLTSPAGGTPGPGRRCKAPSNRSIDWIMSSPKVAWSGYTVDRDSLVRRTTDHAVRYGTVTVDARYFPKATLPKQ